jgi:plasmid stabilization system protein ParE
MYNYSFQSKAQAEYEASLQWYLEHSEQAANFFITSVEKAIQLVCINPQQYKKVRKKYFQISLKKYPFCIVYEIDDASKSILILSVFHQKRNPKRKFR